MITRNETTVQLGFAAILFAMANQISQSADPLPLKEKKPGPLDDIMQMIIPIAASFLKSMVPAHDPSNADKVSLEGLDITNANGEGLGMIPAYLSEVVEALGEDNPVSLVEIMSALAKSVQQKNPTIIKHVIEASFNYMKGKA